ncbi:DUF4179 domain-containing protein [Bacillus sp. RG28]|uniref:DUF4179 domain-containing protein n=1 Tax=Gottfriedia endophytica TaxID=2820819 RepID=A0A940SLX5_9BACI|nr:DUF4179 domain-containing protein [Gottfriedia endophytica]MBP0726768.1 DUF4179 domain-containing protein [Gottfriedia endophytica]
MKKQFLDTEFDISLKDLNSNLMWNKKQKQDLKQSILADIKLLEFNEKNKNLIVSLKNKRVSFPGKLIYSCLAFIILIGITCGASLASPAFASTLKKLPIIGSIFEKMGDKGLQEAKKGGLSKSLNETISIGDSSFTITDVMYDRSRISLGYIFKNAPKNDPLSIFNSVSYKIDNKNVTNLSSDISGDFINDTNFAGVINLYIPSEQNNVSSDLSITFKESNGKKGDWQLNIPLTKIQGKTFFVTEQASYNDYTFTMKKVTLTPATTEINFDFMEPKGMNIMSGMNFRLYDDKGNELKSMGFNSSGSSDSNGKTKNDTSIQFEPIKNIPDYLVLETYFGSTLNEPELRIKIPIKEGE